MKTTLYMEMMTVTMMLQTVLVAMMMMLAVAEKKQTVDSSTDVKLASVVSRFAAPVTDQEVLEKVKGHLPRSTKLVTQWAVRIWNE